MKRCERYDCYLRAGVNMLPSTEERQPMQAFPVENTILLLT